MENKPYIIIGRQDNVRKYEELVLEALKDKIVKEGEVIGNDIVKVDGFLNHQIDVVLLQAMGKAFKERFSDKKIDKILTIEASGIGIAVMTALEFQVPVVFAKKDKPRNVGDEIYETSVFSFTKNKKYTICVAKKYINPRENILVIDDFLANGAAANGLIDMVRQGGANVAGLGIAIEKGFQNGGKELREKGITVESLAIIEGISNNEIIFRTI